MRFSVKIKGDNELFDALSPRKIRAAVKASLKRTAGSVRTAIDTKIREGYSIKKSDLTRAMKVGPVLNDLKVEIHVIDQGDRPPGIFKFGGRAAVQTKEGTWIGIMKRKGVKVIPQAFISTMPSGHKGVFIRLRGGTGKGGRMTRRDVRGRNPPIHEIYGPWITSLVEGEVITKTIQKKVDEVFQKNFDHEIEARLKGYVK